MKEDIYPKIKQLTDWFDNQLNHLKITGEFSKEFRELVETPHITPLLRKCRLQVPQQCTEIILEELEQAYTNFKLWMNIRQISKQMQMEEFIETVEYNIIDTLVERWTTEKINVLIFCDPRFYLYARTALHGVTTSTM